MSFANPHFEEPLWLWLAVLGPILLFGLFRYAAKARRRQLAQIASPHFVTELTHSHSPARRTMKEIVLILCVALFGCALARPQWGELESTDRWLGDDVIFMLDVSRSMLATDIQPNRLERAKFAILDFVRHRGTGRVGLVAFAGGAFLQCPLTFDYDAFEDALGDLNERSIPVGGSDIGRGLEEAFHAMEKKSTRKLIVLLTDGEDLEKKGIKEAEALKKEGVTIYAIGVGTAPGAELRTLGPTGQMEFIRDSQGNVVRSHLDDETLTAIAKASGGSYFPLGRIGEGLEKVQHAIETTNAAGFSRTRAQGVERFHVPLAIALGLLIIESLIGTRRSTAAMKSTNRSPNAAPAVATALLLVTCSLPAFATTEVLTNAATKIAPAPVTARGYYNVGTQKLTDKKFAEAESMLQTAISRQDEKVQPLALYNLGFTRFELGSEELKKTAATKPVKERGERAKKSGDEAILSAEAALASNDVQQMVAAYMRGKGVKKELRGAYDAVHRALEVHAKTLKKWRRSVGDFRSAAELNPADTNATYNAEVVEQAIARLIDSVRQQQMIGMKCAGSCSKLGEVLSQLKGKIPKENMPPGAPGEDGEEDEMGEPQLDDLMGMKEGGPKDGKEMEVSLSPEEAGNLLNGYKLGGNKGLPMGKGEQGEPKDRKRRDW